MSNATKIERFENLQAVAKRLRNDLLQKDFVLLYAHNGTGKTRLSMEFKNLGKSGEARDTLYFNAFTEDLFRVCLKNGKHGTFVDETVRTDRYAMVNGGAFFSCAARERSA